ncbi:sulfite exporter TauE/SafE family protein, partial [Streptomyces sp. NPDC059853]
ADYHWTAVALLAVGSALGGQLGARVGRRLSPAVLRGCIVVVGSAAIVQLVLR